MRDLEETIKEIASMDEADRAALKSSVLDLSEQERFVPNPGPQMMAYYSKADIMLYGGSAGCTSGDTEFLTPTGWKRIDAYQHGDMVAECGRDFEIRYVQPQEYINKPCSELIHFKTGQLSMVLSDCHKMLLYDYEGKLVTKLAVDVANKPSRYKVPANFHVSTSGLEMSDTMLRMAVAIHADGNLTYKKDGSAYCRITLRKERKITRLVDFMSILGIEPHIYKNPKRPTEIRYGFPSPINTKKFEGHWWQANQRQLEIILEEMSHWDGAFSGVTGGDICYNSRHKCDADFIQYAAHACGRIANISYVAPRGNASGMYRVHVTRDKSLKGCVTLRVDSTEITRVPADAMYCFTVNTGFWLARHNGKIFITGNSGKSGLILGLGFTRHKRSLIMRRQYTDLEGLTSDAMRMFGSTSALTGGVRPKIKTDDGRLIEFGACKNDGDEQSWQGQPHDLLCVGKGTRVLMANGCEVNIENLKIGDLVQTLEGAKRVTRKLPVRYDNAVLVEAIDNGVVISSQIQSHSHSFLTNEGWVSYHTCDVSHPCEISQPTLFRSFCKSFVSFAGRFSKEGGYRAIPKQGLGQALKQFRSLAGHQSLPGKFFSYARLNAGTSPVSSCGGRPKFGQCLLSSLFSKVQSTAPRLWAILSSQPSARRDAFCALSSSGLQDCQGDCSKDSRLCGEHTLKYPHPYLKQVDALFYLPQQGDVARQNPNDFAVDAREKTPIHTYQIGEYPHPYTMGTHSSEALVYPVSFRLTPIGVTELYDITVEDVNHFITNNGFINKNCYDELTQFTEHQFRYLQTWNRTVEEGQRCRVVAATNPPTSAAGEWVIGYWRPWLDTTHHNPAKPGELRWFVTDPDGKDMEVPDNTPVHFAGRKEPSLPKSRTFIPGKVGDNPFLDNSYVATLDALPEPLRSAMRDGNFMLSRKDDMRQLIPSEWLRAAVARWEKYKSVGVPMCAMGVDPSQPGGEDETVIAIRYDGWFDNMIVLPAKSMKSEGDIASAILRERRDNAAIVLDMGGGYGGATMLQLKSNEIKVTPYKGSEATAKKTLDRTLGFSNTRSAAYWMMREALDPSQPGGSPICLPNDQKLIADLAAPTFELTSKGFKVEPKDDVRAKLGRSPDRGDAVVMAWWDGLKGMAPLHPAQSYGAKNNMATRGKVILGHQKQRRK